jgi:kumamolisin
MPSERIALRGSERGPIPNSVLAGSPDPNGLIAVTVVLRRRGDDLPPPGTARVTHDEFAHLYGANPHDIPVIEQFAADNDLTVGEIDLARRSIVLSGTVANMGEAFGTQLRLVQSPDGLVRARIGVLFVPVEVGAIVTGVFGLDERPQARNRFRRLIGNVGPRAAGDTSYTPNAVAKLYNFPTAGSGLGQTVGIIELGGGFRSSDLTAYFGKLGIKTPSVTAVAVDGGANVPVGDPNSADGEVLLDIEVVGAVAPKAKIAVYFAPNTDQGFLDAITTAVHDKVRTPSVISISWGSAEVNWTAQSLQAFDQAFQDAGVLGVTVCCASGDGGSADGETDGASHVDFPASSPNALACGGTRLESTGGKITKETVWNQGATNGAGGGGVSDTFPLPSYQAKAGVPVSVNPSHFKGRGVPDVAGDADPGTGYQIHVDGKDGVFGGTSAVAPLWAGLIALLNEQNKKSAGFIHPALYKAGEKPFNDITVGNNGAYSAKAGWDACTGLGTPNGQALLAVVGGKASGRKASK